MIDTKKFFIFGMLTFTVIGICHIANLALFFNVNNFFSHVIGAMQIIFDFVTVGFFHYLYTTQLNQNIELSESSDIKEALKEWKKPETSTKKKK